MPSKDTKVISIRLPFAAFYALETKAKLKGYDSVGEYIKAQLLKSTSCDTTTGFTPQKQVNSGVVTSEVSSQHDVNPVEKAVLGNPYEQRAENQRVKIKKPLMLYNPAVHKVGDRVLVVKGKALVEAIVPELDADGNVVRPI